jgi:signal transduction histidine kinase
MSDVVVERVASDDADSRRVLAEVAETAREMIEGMSDIVWSIDPRRDNVGDVVARLRGFGSDVLEPLGIRWTCEDVSGAVKQRLSPDQRRQFYLIFKEAIHNIARHSGAGNVLLRIQVRDKDLWGEIQDDGRGIFPDAPSGLGIGSMQARAARLGGRFRLAPRPGGGTTATLHLPLKPPNA